MPLNPVFSALMQQYNAWLSEQYRQVLSRFSAADEAGPVTVDSRLWFDQTVELRDSQSGQTVFSGKPLAILGSQPSPATVVELACHAAALCDDDIPAPIRELLAEPAVRSNLFERLLASDFSQMEGDSEQQRPLALSRLIAAIGPMLDDHQLEELLDRYLATERPDDLVTDALISVFGQPDRRLAGLLTARLQAALAAGQPVRGSVECLMILLSETGRTERSPESFAVLRTAFRRAEDKQTAAVCLGDYGDPRGISVLRSFLDSHPETDRATRREILGAIHRLGGMPDN